VNSLADVKGKKFMAVKKSSFGGWQRLLPQMMPLPLRSIAVKLTTISIDNGQAGARPAGDPVRSRQATD